MPDVFQRQVRTSRLLSFVFGEEDTAMRLLTLGVCTLLFVLPGASAQDKAKKGTLVKPVQVWEGRFDRATPASGRYTIDLLASAREFQVPWKIFRWGQKIPRIDFDDHFAVLLIYPGSQYSLEGLMTDEEGDARVVGSGWKEPVDLPFGKWYVLAIFPRDKVKRVDRVKVPPRK
jgi:hypothetical protein